MRATVEQADKYCEKDGEFAVSGTLSKQGEKKMDMELAVQEKAEGMSTEAIIEAHGSGYIVNKGKISERRKRNRRCRAKKLANGRTG